MSDEELKNQLARKKLQLQAQAETIQQQLASIDATMKALDKSVPPSPHDAKLKDIILFAIGQAEKEFTLQDVMNIIVFNYPAIDKKFSLPSIASAFWKIANSEFGLGVVKPGKGRAPTIYYKKKK